MTNLSLFEHAAHEALREAMASTERAQASHGAARIAAERRAAKWYADAAAWRKQGGA